MICLLLCYFCYKRKCLDLEYKLDGWAIEYFDKRFPTTIKCEECVKSSLIIDVATVCMILKEKVDEEII